MSNSIGIPVPDCEPRRAAKAERRTATLRLAERRGESATMVNGEETAFDLSYALNYHKGLPHGPAGQVHRPSYQAMVRMLTGQEYGALETLPIGANRRAGTSTTDPENPPRYSKTIVEKSNPNAKPPGYRKLTSPMTGHVFDPQGADAGDFAIGRAPLVASDELAAEMAELYVMALTRDERFRTMRMNNLPPQIDPAVNALMSMPWFQGGNPPAGLTPAEERRFRSRKAIGTNGDLFRGSTPGAKAGPWVSQFMLAGIDNTNRGFEIDPGSGGKDAAITPTDGYVLFGTQALDQRSVVAKEGVDYLHDWGSWLDCQNGVDFNNLDIFEGDRRFLTTPRDIATYVHYDALYQGYLVACLFMLNEGFAFDRGLPESTSRTRAGFASFGGPHILSLVTEVATRALKAVWRQKWLHHRRARPEMVAALLTLAENDATAIGNDELQTALATLRAKIPVPILDAIAARNQAISAASPRIEELGTAVGVAGFPTIDPAKNFLLPMAFPEGSPTHPAYGAGHATVAGACVTVLKAFFEMYEKNGSEKLWPYRVAANAPEQRIFEASDDGATVELVPGLSGITVQDELDKLAANIAIARNMAGVHYYTDYYESIRLGERVALSIIEEHLTMYGEPVSMSFKSFDGERIRVSSNGGSANLHIYNGNGPERIDLWYSRYAD